MYDMNEKSIYCGVCPIWNKDVGCLNKGMGLYWDTENDGRGGERDVLLCNTDADDPELLAMYGITPPTKWW